MSETDSFIQEVTEEVRQDQMLRYWKKYGALVLGGVALIVGGAAYWNWQEAQDRAAAEQVGGAFVAADPDVPEQLLALPDQIAGPAQVIAELTAASALATEKDYAAAAARYEAIAARDGLTPEYRDLAALQALRMRASEGQTDGAIAALETLAADGAPYRLLAIEFRAALRLLAGETDAAHEDLRLIMGDPGATPDLVQRAVAALRASGGEAADPAG